MGHPRQKRPSKRGGGASSSSAGGNKAKDATAGGGKEQDNNGVACSCKVSKDATEDSSVGIQLEAVSLSVAGRELLEDASLSLQPGGRYGLMGPNGAGKTTLLRQLAVPGRLVPAHIRSLLVEQEDAGDRRTALQTVVEADKSLSALLRREAFLEAAEESHDRVDAAAALSLTRAHLLRTEAEALSRAADRAAGGRAAGGADLRSRWLEADKVAGEAESVAAGYQWLAAEREARAAAKDLEGRMGDTTIAPADSKEGRLQRRRLGKLGFVSGAVLAPQAMARRLRVEADRLARRVGEATQARLLKEESERQAEGAEETGGNKVWDELSEALSAVRLEMTEAGVSRGEAEARGAGILRGLGFSDDMASGKPTKELSGGWRMRVALARALFATPALLMLDEPTNHLDLPAILWLENWLTEVVPPDTMVLLVSHDRSFMDMVCTDMLKLARQRLESFPGMNFSAYAEAVAEGAAAAERSAATLEARKASMAKSIEAMVSKARESGDDKRLKQAAARRKKLEALRKRGSVDSPALDPEMKLSLPCAEPLGYYGAVLQLEDVAVGWDPKSTPLVTGVTLEVDLCSRIGLLGRNGGGKSTLLAAIAGVTKALRGRVHRHHNLRLGYFSQHSVDELLAATLPSMSGVDVLTKRFGIKEQEARAFLSRFGLGGRLGVQPMGTLSGGQKVRLCLSLLFQKPPHMLLLDEPTNHLDVQTVDALSNALEDFDGGLVLVSHDRRLLSDTCEEFYSITKSGKLKPLENGLEQYVASVTKNMNKQ